MMCKHSHSGVTLTFKQPLYTVVEGNVSVDLTVQLVGSSSEEVTGILDTFGGNATGETLRHNRTLLAVDSVCV